VRTCSGQIDTSVFESRTVIGKKGSLGLFKSGHIARHRRHEVVGRLLGGAPLLPARRCCVWPPFTSLRSTTRHHLAVVASHSHWRGNKVTHVRPRRVLAVPGHGVARRPLRWMAARIMVGSVAARLTSTASRLHPPSSRADRSRRHVPLCLKDENRTQSPAFDPFLTASKTSMSGPAASNWAPSKAVQGFMR